MNLAAAVVTTMPNDMWEIYGKRMLQAFSQNWPAEIPLLLALDDDLLKESVAKFTRPQDAVCMGWDKDHKEFFERNKSKDHQTDYRKQLTRFCHKVFAIARAYDTTLHQKKAGEVAPRYIIWMDADVITNRKVTLDDIMQCLPIEGDAVATLQRKDWPHSECGWMAFDLDNKGGDIIAELFKAYVTDRVLTMEQWHDSWVFDVIVKERGLSVTNLTMEAPGLDVWQFSPMGKWSKHYKGPMAKAELMDQPRLQAGQQKQNIVIQTQNAIPHEEICNHIRENQKLIKNWVKPCQKHDEWIVIASAGPLMLAEDLREEVKAGRKIVAVKHALEPLKKAGIKPWACILLDPRDHMTKFVEEPDTDIIWFVASQVEPEVTKNLIIAGCNVWGYHASVGAGEEVLTKEQSYAIISGGSATATRGIFLLSHLGFSKFRLYGYDLSIPDKPNMGEMDDRKQPKHLELSVEFNDRNMIRKRHFWTEPQFIAQFEEMNEIIKSERFEIESFGDGIVPFLVKSKKVSDLRNREMAAKIMGGKNPKYKDMLKCRTSRTSLPRWLLSSLRRRSSASRL